MTLPAIPNRNQTDIEFIETANNFFGALPQFEIDMNALSSTLTAAVAGTAISIPYTFSNLTAAADPGSGFLRLNSSIIASTIAMYVDVLGKDGKDYAAVIDSFALSSSFNKGQIRLFSVANPTKWALCNVTAVTSATGYKILTVSPIAASDAMPFINGDSLAMLFTRTGDVGSNGTILRRTASVVSSATPTADSTNTDLYVVTTLAAAATLSAPSGTPANGQGLMYRIRDDGTARALAYNAIFRSSPDLPFPTSTVPGKTMYIGFIYNSTDLKWDLVSVLNNLG